MRKEIKRTSCLSFFWSLYQQKIVKKKKEFLGKIFITGASGIFAYGQGINCSCSSLEIILQLIFREAYMGMLSTLEEKFQAITLLPASRIEPPFWALSPCVVFLLLSSIKTICWFKKVY